MLERTDSALLSALTFAATFLPAVAGTALLSGAADRLPRRKILVLGDLLRAVLVLLMARPGMEVTGVLCLVLVVTTIDGPYGAARAALIRQLSADDARYQRDSALDETATQTGQVAGYALGGVVVATLGVHASLIVDAATFAFSAALVQLVVHGRPAAAAASGRPVRTSDVRVGWRAVTARRCRTPVLLTWIGVGAAVAPEALALAWARDLGAGPAGAGALLAANPVGGVLGLLLLSRLSPAWAHRLLLPCVALALLPLLLCATELSLASALALVALSGVGLTYSTIARVIFSSQVPDEVRGRAFGVAGSGLIISQGVGIAVAGLLTVWVPPGSAVALCALAGLTGAVVVLVDQRRADSGNCGTVCTPPVDVPTPMPEDSTAIPAHVLPAQVTPTTARDALPSPS